MKLELKTKDVELISIIQTSTHLQWIAKVLYKNREKLLELWQRTRVCMCREKWNEIEKLDESTN